MITVKNLKFEKVNPGKTRGLPFFTCCNCGKHFRLNDQSYSADFEIDDSATVTFVLCGSGCVVEFHKEQRRVVVDYYIQDIIKDAAKVHFQSDIPTLQEFLTTHNLKQ